MHRQQLLLAVQIMQSISRNSLRSIRSANARTEGASKVIDIENGAPRGL
jgi:hypothetical protein